MTSNDLSRLVVRISSPLIDTGKAKLAMLSEVSATTSIGVMVRKAEVTGVFEHLPENIFSPVIVLVETPTGIGAGSTTIDTAQASVVMASAAAGISAPLDSPCPEFTDIGVISAAGQKAARDGFGGLLCIHPRQLKTMAEASMVRWPISRGCYSV